jgi:general secretion pathway protein H
MRSSPVMRKAAAAPQAGFTLLEMLVVLVIAGIIAGVASLTLTRNPRTDLREEGQRLALLFESANDEAQVRGHPLAWQANLQGYQFLERNADSWRTVRDDLFAPRHWSTPINGVAIHYANSEHSASQLEFGVESINLPAVVTLYSPVGQIEIVGTGNGRFTVH